MRKWLIITGLIAVAAFVALWRVPAGFVLDQAQSRLPGMAWSSSSGTAWKGKIRGFEWHGMQLGTLEWTFDGIEDAAGKLSRWHIHSHSGEHDVRALVTLSPAGEIHRAVDVQGVLPAAWVDITGKLPLLYLEGTLDLNIDHLDLEHHLPVNGLGRVTWNDAAVNGGASERFGRLRLDLSPVATSEPKGLAFELNSLEPADISLRGQGAVLRDEYDIDLRLQIALERDDLLQFMSQLGGETGPGLYRFAWQGTLR